MGSDSADEVGILTCELTMLKILTVAAILFCLTADGQANKVRSVLTRCELPDIDGEVYCGKLEVLENRELPEGRRIPLNVIVLMATSQEPEAEPLFFLEGGPGMPATDAAVMFANELPFRQHYDIVLVDQRGTGQSNPLHCDLIGDRTIAQNYLKEMYPAGAVAACRKELEQIADLTQYTTSQFIADIDAVREWLGYEQINIYAISYGTRAAYAYAREYPERVRSAILMGTMPLDGKMPFHHAVAAQAALDLLFADCEADSQCNHLYPELRESLKSVVTGMRDTPLEIRYRPPNGQEQVVSLAASILMEKIRSLLYTSDARAYLPYLIRAAFNGDYKLLLEDMIPTEPDSVQWFAEGLYLSLTSAEDVPLIDTTEARRRNDSTFFGNYRVEQQVRAASLWAKTKVPASFYEFKRIDTPILFISGGRDPVTPPYLAERVAQHCPQSRHLVIPLMSHLPYGLKNAECTYDMIMEFLESKDAARIDTACVSDLQLPHFYPGDHFEHLEGD